MYGSWIVSHDAPDIVAGFRVRRNALVFIDGLLTGVIGRQGQGDIALKMPEQEVQIGDTAADIVFRVEGVADAKALGGFRNELHQALGLFVGQCRRVKSGFLGNHRQHQGRINGIP